jgi:hypothetical protein
VTSKRRRIAVAVLLVLAVGGGLASLFDMVLDRDEAGHDDDESGKVNPPTRLTMQDGIAVLVLSAADQRNSGIETAHPVPLPAKETLVGFGTVLDPAPLSELSDRYLEAETQVQTSAAKLMLSRAAFERAKILHRDQQNISTAQLQAAEGGFEVDKAALAAARTRQTILAAAARQAWGRALGAALTDRDPLLARLIERRDYLVKVTLPPGAMVAAAPEQAIARLNAATEIPLTFVSPATTVDPRLQGISYLYRAPADAALLPGLNLQVLLAVSLVQRGVVMPEAAVVWLNGKAWVYLRMDPNTFHRREIAPDRTAPDGGYIVPDVPLAAEIVVRGAQMLLSEEFRAQVPIED